MRITGRFGESSTPHGCRSAKCCDLVSQHLVDTAPYCGRFAAPPVILIDGFECGTGRKYRRNPARPVVATGSDGIHHATCARSGTLPRHGTSLALATGLVERFYKGRDSQQWLPKTVGTYPPVLLYSDCPNCPSVQDGQPVRRAGHSSVHSGVQPWELPSPAVSAQGGQAPGRCGPAGQGDQDAGGRSVYAALPATDPAVVRIVGSQRLFEAVVGILVSAYRRLPS